jgi:UDP-3-O-[3-hydroxymyristoyl] glucosamine N-acyltransferase
MENQINNNVKIGDNFQIGYYNVIGFEGYQLTKENVQIKHQGKVIIGNNVLLRHHICIDAGLEEKDATILGNNVAIDNFVHVAHNCHLGDYVNLIAGVKLGGSVKIGEHSFIGLNACIKPGVTIGKRCLVGIGAVVTKNIPDGEVWVGNPAKKLKYSFRKLWTIRMKKLLRRKL